MSTKHVIDPTIQPPLFSEVNGGFEASYPVVKKPPVLNLTLVEGENDDLFMAVNGEMRPMDVDNLAFLYDSLASMSARNSDNHFSELLEHDNGFGIRLNASRPIKHRDGHPVDPRYRGRRAEIRAHELDKEAKRSFLKGIGALAIKADFPTTTRVMEEVEPSRTYEEFDHYYGKPNRLSRSSLQKKIVKHYQKMVTKTEGRKISQKRARQEMAGIVKATEIQEGR